MPEIGEERSGKELGYKSDSSKYVFQPCPRCNKPRWVRRPKAHKLCQSCGRKEYARSVHSGEIEQAIANGAAKIGEDGKVYYKHPCRVCGTEIWHRKSQTDRTCSTECALSIRLSYDKAPKWNGGTRANKGYMEIKLPKDHPFYCMASKDGYVLRHRLVMAEHIGRTLESWEIVHHKSEDKDASGVVNDDLSNLELLPNQTSHRPSIEIQRELNRLKSRVSVLEEENRSLRSELKLVKWHVSDIRSDLRYDTGNPEPSSDGSTPSRACVENRGDAPGQQRVMVCSDPTENGGKSKVESSFSRSPRSSRAARLRSPGATSL